MNRKSQVPSQMRHEQKCEASSDESDPDADGEDSEEKEAAKKGLDKVLGLARAGTMNGLTDQMDIFGFSANKKDFNTDNPQYMLKTTKRLSKK